VRQVVIGELAASEDLVDEREPRRRTVPHADGNRAVERHHR
jgi:hypothetical protein